MPETEVAITELLEIDPERVDAVTSPANGTEWLMLKAIDDSQTVTDTDGVLAELAKDDGGDDDSGDDGDSKDCSTCDGSGKIMDGNRKCPDCGGSGDASKAIKPMVGETMEEFQARKAGAAASGEPVPVLDDCPTCKGTGEIKDGTADGKTCPDCDGSGNDAKVPQDDSLNTVDADGGSITEGAGGRETVDKATDEDVEKKNVDPNVGGGVDRDKLKGGDFAGKNRSFPIVTPGDVSDAASSIGRAGADNYSADQLKSNIIAIAKRKGASFVAQLPKAWTDGDASKADLSGSMYSAPNPASGRSCFTRNRPRR